MLTIRQVELLYRLFAFRNFIKRSSDRILTIPSDGRIIAVHAYYTHALCANRRLDNPPVAPLGPYWVTARARDVHDDEILYDDLWLFRRIAGHDAVVLRKTEFVWNWCSYICSDALFCRSCL